MRNKYKVGDKVWIKEDIKFGKYKGTTTYFQINQGEEDIRGKEVIITSYHTDGSTGLNCKGYKNFHWKMIDEEKTSGIINYEIY